jgi:hypothetical protein
MKNNGPGKGKLMKRAALLSAILLIALLWSLGTKESGLTLSSPSIGAGKNVARITQVIISPSSADLESVLNAQVQSENPGQERVEYRYRWLVNQKEVGDQPFLALKGFQPGDLVSVEVTPSAKNGAGISVQSASLKISNNPPMITAVKFLPLELEAGQAVQAEVEAFDKDGDPISYTYRWYINDQLIQESSEARLGGEFIHSADKVSLEVIPSDPFSKGAAKTSEAMRVTNRPPEITSSPTTVMQEGKYVYQVTAKDPDGDPLSFRLVEGPSGMRLDPVSGLLEWKVETLSQQKASIIIQVEDAKGGQSRQQFDLRMG